ncbi:MAG: PEP/pyruvate-binding domain-containing protein [Patescibacteria group bacterium]|jgi:phosphohistidine swiveling domain-containing protein
MFGEKTKRLQALKSAGFNVPAFIGISTTEIEKDSKTLAEQALESLGGKLFAVRSSALVEDADQSSMAGQFMTKLAVTRKGLSSAIDEVRAQAKDRLGSLLEFSIIIQEFIEPDFSGVVFTRAPHGGRETIVEFHTGRGDAVVSGEVKPERLVYYRGQGPIASELPNIEDARQQFLAIEKLFDFPQDIEWCVKAGKWYILQSRPITSVTKEQIKTIEDLECELPKGKYYFAKTEVCDVAPRPCKETFELLEEMYGEDGPVEQAYKKLGLAYSDTSFLKVFVGELYVDRERELQSLFPSHSYFVGEGYTAKPVRLKGFLTSLRNTRRLQKLHGKLDEISTNLESRLSRKFSASSLEQAKREFFEDYEVIFTTNLFAERALDRLKRSLPSSTGLAEALQYFPTDLPAVWNPPADIIGNTFEFTDTSVFVSVLDTIISPIIPNGIPLPELREAQLFLRLREYSRWLALRHITRLRGMIPGSSSRSGSKTGSIHGSTPAIVTDTPLSLGENKPIGVSAGQAEGKLVLTPEAGGILVTSALTPDIANHARLLKGVIADHGGLLSHFAIIAREMGLPVVVNYPIHELPIGKLVAMDGSTGEVRIK